MSEHHEYLNFNEGGTIKLVEPTDRGIDISDFDKILRRGMADFGIFYQAYKDCLV